MFIAALFTIAKIWKQPKCPYVEPKTQSRGTSKTKQKQTHRHRDQTGGC